MSWEKIIKRNCGCGKDVCETYGEVKKGKGERHFYIENGKPVQWTGETHKHPDGTLMSGKEHKEGVSKELFHFYDLDKKYLKHLSKETTALKGEKILEEDEPFEKLVGNQDRIDADADGKITGNDFKILGRRAKLKKGHDLLKRGKSFTRRKKIAEHNKPIQKLIQELEEEYEDAHSSLIAMTTSKTTQAIGYERQMAKVKELERVCTKIKARIKEQQKQLKALANENKSKGRGFTA